MYTKLWKIEGKEELVEAVDEPLEMRISVVGYEEMVTKNSPDLSLKRGRGMKVSKHSIMLIICLKEL